MSIAWKIFLGFCVVLLVVLGLGLWSLRATRQLHDLNRALLTRAIPVVRLEVTLAELVPTLTRHETRALYLRDPTYETLHRKGAHAFQLQLDSLADLLDGSEAQAALAGVRTRFLAYLEQVRQEWVAVGAGRRDEALRRSEGPTRAASDALTASLETLWTHSQADVARQVVAAGTLERWARSAALLSLGISLAVGVGVAAMVAVQVARPIRALQRATHRIAQGEYDVALPLRTRDEVGALTRAFRAMAEQLRAMDALKADLLANISHDIRSPLSSIATAAELLQRAPLGSKEARWLQVIQLDSHKILRLTHQILDLAKLRAGKLQLTFAPAELGQITGKAADELRPEAEEKGVTLNVTVSEALPLVICDADRLQQVIANLLSNAIRFTPKGGQISMTAHEADAALLVTVADTGAGIPAAELPYVFDRYHQAHRRRDGAGLGLAIVKEFVEAHGGRVWVESHEGEGSRFHIALPPEGPKT